MNIVRAMTGMKAKAAPTGVRRNDRSIVGEPIATATHNKAAASRISRETSETENRIKTKNVTQIADKADVRWLLIGLIVIMD